MKASILFILSFMWVSVSFAEKADPDPARFAEDIKRFVQWDSKNTLPSSPILFVGSSSIRLWKTAQAFPKLKVVNRGFGGSELSDVIHYYDHLVKPYAPKTVVLYEGDNDIANGKSAEQVFEDYQQFIAMLAKDFPKTKVVFISIKPSKLRWEQWPEMVKANELIRKYTTNIKHLEYADLASPLFDQQGQLLDVFMSDDLHLNQYGYDLWQKALLPYL